MATPSSGCGWPRPTRATRARLAAGSKAMEIFADLETEIALREGGDEGLCVAYDMVEFLAPLRSGDFVEGRARVVGRGRIEPPDRGRDPQASSRSTSTGS